MFTQISRTLFTRPTLARSLLQPKYFTNKVSQMPNFNRSFSQLSPPPKESQSYKTSEGPQNATPNSAQGPKVDDIIRADKNLNGFLSKIYRVTGMSFACTLGVAYGLASYAAITPELVSLYLALGGISTLAGIMGTQSISPTLQIEKLPRGKKLEKIVNPLSRKLSYSAAVIGSGIAMAPIIQTVGLIDLTILPIAAIISILTMGGASLYAMYKPLGEFKAREATLFSGLFGLICVNVFSLALHFTIGPNPFSYAWMNTETYIGIGLFSAYQAYDTQKAVQAFKEGKYDYLDHSLQFFLNIQNIFVRYLEIVAKSKKK